MKAKMVAPFAGLAAVSVVGTIVVSGMIPGAKVAREKKNIEIVYALDSAGTNLVVTAPDFDNCKNQGAKTGCFKIKKSKTGLIKFTFDTTDTSWYLKQFTICRGDAKIKTACNSDLTLEEQLEFTVMNNAQGDTKLDTPASGQVSLTPLGAATRTFYVYDNNTINQDYFYNIQVCNSPTNCATLDPPVENKGLPN